MTPQDLKARTKQFALRVLKLVATLPRTVEGRAIANQFIEGKLFPSERVKPLLKEANELVAIFVTSRKSASANLKSSI